MSWMHILVAVGLLAVGGDAAACDAAKKEPGPVPNQNTCGAGASVAFPGAGDATLTTGSTCAPTCTAGYMVAGMPAGKASILCSGTTLTPATFTCDPAPCTNVLNSNGASASGPACKCNNGYSADTPSATSQTVTWSGSPHQTSPGTCVPHTCGVINSNMLPGPACACNSGYSADAATGSSQLVTWTDLTAGSCVAHTCTVHNSNMAPGPACTCNPGYVANVPSNLSQVVSWNGLQPGTCVPATTTPPPPTTPIPTSPPPSTNWPLWIGAGAAVIAAAVLGVYALRPPPKKRAVKAPLVHTPPPVRVVSPPVQLVAPPLQVASFQPVAPVFPQPVYSRPLM